MQKLAPKKAKKIRNFNMYWKKSQCTLDKFISQVNIIFQTKPMTNIREKNKYLYLATFLSDISQCK